MRVLVATCSAVLLVPLLPALPTHYLTFMAALAGVVLLSSRAWRPLAVFLLVFSACLAVYGLRLGERLDSSLAGSVQRIEGTVVSLPRRRDELLEFRFRPKARKDLPGAILVRWFRDGPEMAIGQRWLLELRLQPPWGVVNFHGADRERWFFAEGIGARGSVRNGALVAPAPEAKFPLQRIRAGLNERIAQRVEDPLRRGVIQALATADRSGVAQAENELLRSTGTLHLLAISGLHIGLVAAGGMLIGRRALHVLPLSGRGLAFFHLPLLAAMLMAACYALLANLGVSTVRALLMLLAVLTVMAASRSSGAWRVFLAALALVLLSNPFAPLSSGFWFSFAAVFALLWTFQPRPGVRSLLSGALTAQAAVFLVLLPVNAAWQGSATLLAYPANLVAIPWVSFTVVPPVLAGIALSPVSDVAGAATWSLAGFAVSGLFQFLSWLADTLPGTFPLRSLSIAGLVGAFCGALLLLLPRGFPGRWLGLFLLLPLVLPPRPSTESGSLRVEALDVGQGTAVLVSTENNLLLYDTGPGDGAGADRVASVIVPAIVELGQGAPERIVISHSDLDHAGGLPSVRKRYPLARISGSFSGDWSGVERCVRGLSWRRDGFEFRVLHPSRGLPYLKNNSSCVLAVRRGQAGLLLPGDIETAIEERLLMDGLGDFPLMLAAHHGSAGSSAQAFVETVSPQAVIASAGIGNRFGFPRPEVRGRLSRLGIPLWSTGECGGLSVTVAADGFLEAASARPQRPRIWRWPAAPGCP
jgi:competence protein ComEC